MRTLVQRLDGSNIYNSLANFGRAIKKHMVPIILAGALLSSAYIALSQPAGNSAYAKTEDTAGAYIRLADPTPAIDKIVDVEFGVTIPDKSWEIDFYMPGLKSEGDNPCPESVVISSPYEGTCTMRVDEAGQHMIGALVTDLSDFDSFFVDSTWFGAVESIYLPLVQSEGYKYQQQHRHPSQLYRNLLLCYLLHRLIHLFLSQIKIVQHLHQYIIDKSFSKFYIELLYAL
ncbi:hypothetical protein JXB41_05585 [Candidatus Woesearchaeota archaeon]|nr:hypothetical protein [Candidatus Woesearchaeota archaeon]